MPAKDGLRLDDHERPFPLSPSVSEHGPESSIEVGELQPPVRRGLKNRELMAQSEILEDQLTTTPENGCSRSKHDSEKADHHWRRILLAGAQTANHGADEVSDRDQ